MGQNNIDAILGWWLLERQGNKGWLLEASEKYLVLTQPNFSIN
jgi:hypothetical protein